MNYNYIYFNTTYSVKGRIDKNEYNSICLQEVASLPNVQVISTPLDYSNTFVRRLFSFSRLIDKRFKTSLVKVWFPHIFKSRFSTANTPICFVISSYNLPLEYFSYLKKVYPNCRLVKICRDLVDIHLQSNPEYTAENLKRYFDLCMTFDHNEAVKYGFTYFHEIGSKIEIPISPNYPISDVFIAAKAKDRLPKILKAYEIFTNAGLRCDFYLTGVPVESRELKKGITYADSYMPYTEMLYRAINSLCLFDINQSGAVGYTSRFLEAIMYNKKIIINNPTVLESEFYNPEFIQYFFDVEDIDPKFVLADKEVNYFYNGEFSPVKLIQIIEEELNHES